MICRKCCPPRDQNIQEGGWGWMIVCGCFLNQLLFEGLVRSYGFVYLTLQENFHGSAVVTSWIQACFSGIALALGPLASVLTEKYTCRKVVICGGALICVGLVLSSLTPNLYFLYFSYSLLGGIGGSFIYSPMFIVVSQYFDKKRGIALGIASLGAAVGTFVVPTLVSYLLDNYGYRGCLLIQAGVMLNHCVSGSVYRPFKRRPVTSQQDCDECDDVIIEEVEFPENEINADFDITQSVQNLRRPLNALPVYLQTDGCHSDGALDKYNKTQFTNRDYLFANFNVSSEMRPRSTKSVTGSIAILFERAMSSTFEMTEKSATTDKTLAKGEHSVNGNLINVKVLVQGDTLTTSKLDIRTSKVTPPKSMKSRLSIFKNASYLLFCLQMFTLSSTILPNFLFLPPLAKEKGLKDEQIALLLAIIGGSGFVGTFVIGVLFDLPTIRRHKRAFYSSLAMFHGVATGCIAVAPDIISMGVMAVCIGFVITSLIGQRANATSHYVTADQLPLAFGIITMFQGLGNLVGPAIQGMLKDHFDTYKPCFFFGGGVLVSSSVLVILDYVIRLRMENPKAKQTSGHT